MLSLQIVRGVLEFTLAITTRCLYFVEICVECVPGMRVIMSFTCDPYTHHLSLKPPHYTVHVFEGVLMLCLEMCLLLGRFLPWKNKYDVGTAGTLHKPFRQSRDATATSSRPARRRGSVLRWPGHLSS